MASNIKTAKGNSQDISMQRACVICKEVTERRHLNYGADACFSCRAFFRRAHQKLKPPKFSCSTSNNCEITVATRRRCQACRYRLCIESGMRPDFVLSAEQRQARIEKQRLKKHKKVRSESNLMLQIKEAREEKANDGCHCSLSKLQNKFTSAWNEQLQKYLPPEDLIVEGFQDPVPRHVLKRHVKRLAKFFCEFAKNDDFFRSLSPNDQSKLVQNNAQMFIYFVLMQFFSAKSVSDRLTWLLVSPCKIESEEIPYVDKSQFGIPEPVTISSKVLPLFTYLLTFNTRFPALLDNYEQIEEKLESTQKSLVVTGDCRCEVSNVVQALDQVVTVFSNKPPSCFAGLETPISLLYSDEEEVYFQKQMQLFSDAYHEVSFGEDLLKEFIMYSLDVPVSKHFMPQTMATFAERFLRILKRHQGIENREISHLWQRNLCKAVALSVVKSSHCQTGNQQMRFCLGDLDSEIFTENYEKFIKKRDIKKMALKDINRQTEILDEKTLARYGTLLCNLGPLVRDVESYKMFSMFLLFDSTEEISSVVTNIKESYVTLFGRRFQTQGGNLNIFYSSLSDIEELGRIVNSLIQGFKAK